MMLYTDCATQWPGLPFESINRVYVQPVGRSVPA